MMNNRKTAYKVVKVKKNKDRVSVLPLKWHPLHKIYMHQNKVNVVDSGCVFKYPGCARNWLGLQAYSTMCKVLPKFEYGEKLELWEVSYDEILPVKRILRPSILFWRKNFQEYKDVFFKKIDQGFLEMMNYAEEQPDFSDVSDGHIKDTMIVSNIKLEERLFASRSLRTGCGWYLE